MSLSDRMAIMKEGNILQVGNPVEVYEKPLDKYVANFIGTAIILNNVDFPQPDDPKRLKSSDLLISKLTLSKAFVFPKLLDTPSIFRKVSDI